MNEAARQLVNGWLRELGGRAGLDLGLDDAGQCSLRYAGETTATIALDPGGEILYLSAPLKQFALHNDKAMLDVYRWALEVNYLCIETHGCTLALDNQQMVLCFGQPVEKQDATGFVNLIGNFLETAHQLRERAQRKLQESGWSPNEPAATKYEPLMVDMRYLA